MANIIAVIWDCDKTLVDGYMQDPIFEEYGVDPKAFWDEVNALPAKYAAEGVKVNPDTIYLNHFIRCAKNGTFPGLNNAKLREFGEKLRLYKGIPEIFEKTKHLFDEEKSCRDYRIQVEHYIVSTGFAEEIRGSKLMPYVEEIWGCELIETEMPDGSRVIGEIGYTIDNSTKTRAIFEINKGVNKLENMSVNTTVPEELRRVPIENMIYIADGPSDISAFSVVKRGGGATFAIYPRGDMRALKQVEQMRQDGRVEMFAEADYSEGTTAEMWIVNKIMQIAERIKRNEREKLLGNISDAPGYLY